MTREALFRDPARGGMKRAAFEMHCPEAQLVVKDLGDSSVGVEGCGQRTVYLYDGDTGAWSGDGSDTRTVRTSASGAPASR